MAQKKKKREVVDEINERYGRVQKDLDFIYQFLEQLRPEAKKNICYELRLNLVLMIKEMFGEGE